MAVGCDPDRLSLSGEPVRLASVALIGDTAAFDVARDGTVIDSEAADMPEGKYTAVLVNRSRVAADGRSMLLREIAAPECHFWSVDLRRGTRTRVPFDGDNHFAVWHPDGQLTWSNDVDGSRAIRMARSDGPRRDAEAARPGTHERWPESWTRDGARLALTKTHPDTSDDLWLLETGTGATRPMESRAGLAVRWGTIIRSSSQNTGAVCVQVVAVTS